MALRSQSPVSFLPELRSSSRAIGENTMYALLNAEPPDENEPSKSVTSPLHTAESLEQSVSPSSSGADTVPEINLWTRSHCFLPLSYMMVGTFQGLSSGVMTMFLLDINATEAQQLTIKTLRSLPAILKIGFGFISDAYPLFGYRRKVYMSIGWVTSSLSMLGLLGSGSNIPSISLFYFLFGFGYWMADVISDSIMVSIVFTH